MAYVEGNLKMWLHDERSWAEMWAEAGKEPK
jgi:hypothetical protein